MYAVLSGHSKFFSLLNKAGLIDQGSTNLNFLSRSENYTVFVPTDEALNNYQVDTLDNYELSEFIKYHFIRGEMIFTDNKQPSGTYNTINGANLNIKTGPDIIEILDDTGNPYVSIPEQEYVTNVMVTERSTVSSVVHEIDKVLIQQ